MLRATKEEMCRMFARGEKCERVAEKMELSLQQVNHEYLLYLDMSIPEKLAITMLPELVTNRMHRLIDDIHDLGLLDAMVATADVKMVVSLLDMKRKIKERMRKELSSSEEAAQMNEDNNEELMEQFEEVYRKILEDDKRREQSPESSRQEDGSKN